MKKAVFLRAAACLLVSFCDKDNPPGGTISWTMDDFIAQVQGRWVQMGR